MIKTLTTKLVKGFKEEYMTLGSDNKKVAYLKKMERAFKRAYKINVQVKYIDIKHSKSMTGKSTIKGYHRGGDSVVVVFVSDSKMKDTKTLFHELTHAYQYQKMTSKFKASRQQLKDNKVSYYNSWHERHARHCAELLVNSFDFSLNLEDTMNYNIAA